jgi:hypothetical protein
MNPHYYIMKNKKILRLESNEVFSSLPPHIQENALDPQEIESLDQAQANWRVVIFRDEILDLEEFNLWIHSPEALVENEDHSELIAN